MKIIVLAGGASAERDVSLESGTNVARALRERGHSVELVDPLDQPVRSLALSCDVIVPMLHGTGAEDGTLQDDLNSLGLPWLGSSPEASRLTFDKVATRERLQSCGIPVPEGVSFDSSNFQERLRDFVWTVDYPIVLKPACQGSSVGVSIVRNDTELVPAVENVFRWGTSGLAEQYIPGREVTVPVIDGELFPSIEIVPARSWYDYTAKYSDDATQYLLNPDSLPVGLCDAVKRACEVCGVTAISRTDLRVDPEGRFYLLEINTIPGMTSHSLVPMSISAKGMTTGELLEKLLQKRLHGIQ